MSLYPDLNNVSTSQPKPATRRRAAPEAPTNPETSQFPTMHADGKTAYTPEKFQYGFAVPTNSRLFIQTQFISNKEPTPSGWAILTVAEANLCGTGFLSGLGGQTCKLQDGRIEAGQIFENSEGNLDCEWKFIGHCHNPQEADDVDSRMASMSISNRDFAGNIIRIANAVATPTGWAVLTVDEATAHLQKCLSLLQDHETARLTNGKIQSGQILTQLVLQGQDLSECSHKIIGKCVNPAEADILPGSMKVLTPSPSAPSIAPEEQSENDADFGTAPSDQFTAKPSLAMVPDHKLELHPTQLGSETGQLIVKNPKTPDDFAGYTAHPLLKHLCNANTLRLRHFFENRHTKFEIRTDDSPHVFVQGKQEESMINGFTLKVLSLGIVKTKFELSLSDNAGQRMITVVRPIGASTFLNVYFEYFGKKEFIGKVQPTGFNLNRISYNIFNENAYHIYTFQGGMLRGLFSDGYELVNPNKKKQVYAKYARNGDIKLLTQKGAQLQFPGDEGRMMMKHRMLILAAGMVMKLHV